MALEEAGQDLASAQGAGAGSARAQEREQAKLKLFRERRDLVIEFINGVLPLLCTLYKEKTGVVISRKVRASEGHSWCGMGGEKDARTVIHANHAHLTLCLRPLLHRSSAS